MSHLESFCHVPESNPAGIFTVITEILQMDVGEKSHLPRIQRGEGKTNIEDDSRVWTWRPSGFGSLSRV